MCNKDKTTSSNKSMLHENPTITFNSVWPAIKFANNRTPKLIGLKIYEISSIGTNNKANPNEVLAGKKIDSIVNLCFWIQIISIAIKIVKDKVKVTIK